MSSDAAIVGIDAALSSPSPTAGIERKGGPDSDENSIESLEDALQRQDDDGWEDVEEDTESLTFISLFEDRAFRDLQSMFEYDRSRHGFDLVQTRKHLGLDFMESMKLVNFIRSEVKQGRTITSISSKYEFANDHYLQPVLEDDSVLFNLEDTDAVPSEAGSDQPRPGEPNRAQQDAFLREAEARPDKANDMEYTTTSKDDKSYFESYSFREIHEVMLKDTARTNAYRDFIYGNKHLFDGKVVLDVGCGTGILSMMCAKAGATRVFAVDNSAIIEKARVNVFVNKLDSKISCMRGKIEDVQLPVKHVDIIISEWMGYGLLYEAMLDSVIFARDKWLHADGLMVPSDIKLFIAPLADPELVMDKISFWNDVYGFDMTSMQENIYREPLVETTPVSTIASNLTDPGHQFLHFDLHKANVEDLSFTRVPFSLVLKQDIDALDGFVLWFDAVFKTSRQASQDGPVTLSTGPQAKDTHWHQAKLLVEHLKCKALPLPNGQRISGRISYTKPKENPRQLLISVEWTTEGAAEPLQTREEGKQTWHLE